MNIVGNRRAVGPLGIAVALLVGGVAIAPVSAAETPAKSTGQGQVTFTKDVAPILQRSCQRCHRPEAIAPMSLLTYEDARPWARRIKHQVVAREMPPWYIDRNVGVRTFKDDESLSEEEIALIAKWADSGAPKGNPADMPPPRQFQENDIWTIGEPDHVVILHETVMPAEGPDKFVYPIVDLKLKEDVWVKAVEMKATKGMKAFHHGDVFIGADEEGAMSREGFLVQYGLGKNGDIFPDNTGRLLKASDKYMLDLHLHSYGEETPIAFALALKVYPKGFVPKYELKTTRGGGGGELDIPAQADNVRVDGYSTFPKAARIVSFQPHMHNRGKAQCMEAIFPPEEAENDHNMNRQKVQTLSCVDRYRFAWHLVYHFEDDEQPLVPAGTILHVSSWYNNTSGNKFAADPDNWVGGGERTIDEMAFAWLSYYYLTDEDYKQQVAERKAKPKKTTTSD